MSPESESIKIANISAEGKKEAARINAEAHYAAKKEAARIKADAKKEAARIKADAQYAISNYQLVGALVTPAVLLFVAHRGNYFKKVQTTSQSVLDISSKMVQTLNGQSHKEYSKSMALIYGEMNQYPHSKRLECLLMSFKDHIYKYPRTDSWNQINDARSSCMEYINEVAYLKSLANFSRRNADPEMALILDKATELLDSKTLNKEGFSIAKELTNQFKLARKEMDLANKSNH